MKIEQLPSGSYRVRKMVNGTMITKVYHEKPTEIQVLRDMGLNVDINPKSTFYEASLDYIESKKNILSPSTIRSYNDMVRCMPSELSTCKVKNVTAILVQKTINKIAKTKSAKTTRNYHGFISSVLRVYKPELVLRTTLPINRPKEKYIPTKEEVSAVLDYVRNVRGGEYYVPVILGAFGLRRSEIASLTPSDIEGNIVSVKRGKVLNEDKEWVIKDMPKTVSSVRTIPIPWEVAAEIKEKGYVYKYHPGNISIVINQACDELGIQRFSLHSLRHFFCSQLSANNVDVETILSLGGWKTDHVMKTVYRHKVTEKELEASEMLEEMLIEP